MYFWSQKPNLLKKIIFSHLIFEISFFPQNLKIYTLGQKNRKKGQKNTFYFEDPGNPLDVPFLIISTCCVYLFESYYFFKKAFE